MGDYKASDNMCTFVRRRKIYSEYNAKERDTLPGEYKTNTYKISTQILSPDKHSMSRKISQIRSRYLRHTHITFYRLLIITAVTAQEGST